MDLLNGSPCAEPAIRVGQELRKARELKGIELGDASRAVNIHPSYLTAIENGQFEHLPNRAFTIGYVARYARYLGLENVVDRLQGEIAPVRAVFDDHLVIAPLPDHRFRRPVMIGAALLLFVAVIFVARPYEQTADVDLVPPPTEVAVTPSASLRADLTPSALERTRIAASPLEPRIAVTPAASLRADLTPAAIEQARLAAIPLEPRIAVTPAASLRADLTPAAIRQQTRALALLPMPLPTGIAVTPRASVRPDLAPAAIAEEIRIARIPLPTTVAVTRPASLRADLTPEAIERARVAAIPLEPRIVVTPSTTLRADLTPQAIEEARIASIPVEAAIPVTPHASPRPDLMPAAIAQERIIAAIPLPSEVAVTPLRPLRSDLTPEALREPRVAALFPMPLPATIPVTRPATLRADLEPEAVEQAFAEEVIAAAPPPITRISVSPNVPRNDDRAQYVQPDLPAGRQLGVGNRSSRITLRVHGPTFVAVRDARSRAFLERSLTRGDTYRVPNLANLRLTARDGGAVEILLDGVSLGFAGSRGLQTNSLALNPQTIADRLRRF